MRFLVDNNNKRSRYFPVRGKALKLPVYFPSISSVKTGLSPFSYFRILKSLNQPHFLISAFDIARARNPFEFIQELHQNQADDGAIVLMDSGNYESYWIRDKSWDMKAFNAVLAENVCDLAFCYDNQFPDKDPIKNAEAVVLSTRESQSTINTASVIPIIHCDKSRLNEAVLSLHAQTNALMVSIPERILGDGLIERITTVTNLRRALNQLDNYVYIHLLGTGNPLSLLLLSLAGADSFDGLEWCQTVVNTQTATLYHFQQRELILDDCNFCKSDLDYTLKTLGHNLNFYNHWMNKIQSAMDHGAEKDLLKEWLDPKFVMELQKIWDQ
ncbi:MAG: hypothetical protein L6Q81_12565 [Bacteroidia bacterium]|nr:hypothetical protein [Bacteroidia bacterium]